MPCHTRMKTIFLQGLLWLCLLQFSTVFSIIEPGYLDFDNLPDTNFSCVGKVIGGYYADIETSCQMFHVCTIGQLDEPMDIRFLCLNGTVFDQETRVCERVDEVDCSKSEKFYHLNLELYGNTAPPIVEEPEVTEQLRAVSTSTTTAKPTTTRTTRATFYTTSVPAAAPSTHSTPKVITSNQFPVSGSPDIRFNPEEINIRLTPGSPPIIKSPSVSYQQQAYHGGDSTITITTHTSIFKEDRASSTSSTQKPKSVVNYGLQHSTKQNFRPYDYTYQQTENSDVDYHTDLPSGEYSYQESNTNLEHYDRKGYQGGSGNKQVFSVSATRRPEHSASFPSSTSFPSSLKPPQRYNYQRTEKIKTQVSSSDFPSLPTLTFSSPAPFSLIRHIETKRSNDNQKRPRIIVSASASVSDASGRRLNYSLGTIGTSHIIPKAPSSYDDYKETDVGLDPFYHDVPKVKNTRHKRDITEANESSTTSSFDDSKEVSHNPNEEVANEEHLEKTPWIPPDYVDDNYEPVIYNNPDNSSNLHSYSHTKSTDSDTELNKETEKSTAVQSNSSKQEILAGEQSATTPWLPPEYVDDNYEPMTYTKNTDNSSLTHNTTQPDAATDENEYDEAEYEYYDYVDDNYEPSAYDNFETENENYTTETSNSQTDILTTEAHTEPSSKRLTQETSIEVNTVTESMKQLNTTTVIPFRRNTVYPLQLHKLEDKEVIFDSREKYITPTATEVQSFKNVAAEKELEYAPATDKQHYTSPLKHLDVTDSDISTKSFSSTLANLDSTIYNSTVVDPPLLEITAAENTNATVVNSNSLASYITTTNTPVTTLENANVNLSTSNPLYLRLPDSEYIPSDFETADSKRESETTQYYTHEDSISNSSVLEHTTTEFTKSSNKSGSNGFELFTSPTSAVPSDESSTTIQNIDTESTTIPIQEHLITQSVTQEYIRSFTEIPDVQTTTEISDPTIFYLTTQQHTTDEITTISVLTTETPTTAQSAILQPDELETTTSIAGSLYTSALQPFPTSNVLDEDSPANISNLDKNSNKSSVIYDPESDRTSTTSLPETTSLSPTENTIITTTTEATTLNSESPTEITTSETEITTTEKPTSSTTRYSYLRTREPAYKRYARTRPTPSGHRFSSHNIHMSQSLLKLQSNIKMTPVTTTTSNSLSEMNEHEAHRPSRRRQNSRRVLPNNRNKTNTSVDGKQHQIRKEDTSNESIRSTTPISMNISSEDVPVTDAPLSKSANPTESKSRKGALLPTTPLSQTFFIPRRFSYDSTRSFNCFGRAMNKFYEDPRDCRLFHYCTPGYTKTQVLDMKFVCDYGTYFDPDKLICTKVKPHRCK